jgi:hypothetical protein
MYTIRATHKLLTLMKATPEMNPPTPTTILGDWYVNVTDYGLIICISEKTLLPVLLPREALCTIATELPRALAAILDKLGIDRAAIERERFAMGNSLVSTTASRRLLGFLNDFARMMEPSPDYEGHSSLLKASIWLANTPCNASSPNATWPNAATKAAFKD